MKHSGYCVFDINDRKEKKQKKSIEQLQKWSLRCQKKKKKIRM